MSLKNHRETRRPPRYLGVLQDRCLPATITITRLAANQPADGKVTVREALEAANTNARVDGASAGEAGVDSIVFQPGLVGTINLNGTQLEIMESVTSQGLGPALTVLDAGGLSRIFEITP